MQIILESPYDEYIAKHIENGNFQNAEQVVQYALNEKFQFDHWDSHTISLVEEGLKDVEEGTGRNVGKLGAFVCEGLDDGRNIKVNVGSGFTDSDRDSFWNDRSTLIGNIVEVRADAITQNQDGTYSLRFPRFLRFRGFKAGEKI